jgi:hypothetical protein
MLKININVCKGSLSWKVGQQEAADVWFRVVSN